MNNAEINSMGNNLYRQNKKKKKNDDLDFIVCATFASSNECIYATNCKIEGLREYRPFGSFHRQWKHLYVQHLVTQSRGNYGRWTRSFRYCFRETRRFARALCARLKTDIGARPITSQLKRDFYDLGSRFI